MGMGVSLSDAGAAIAVSVAVVTVVVLLLTLLEGDAKISKKLRLHRTRSLLSNCRDPRLWALPARTGEGGVMCSHDGHAESYAPPLANSRRRI